MESVIFRTKLNIVGIFLNSKLGRKTPFVCKLPSMCAYQTRANFSFHLCVSHSWIVSDASSLTWLCKIPMRWHLKEALLTWHHQTNWNNQSVIVNILHRLNIIFLATATFIVCVLEVILKDGWISMAWPGSCHGVLGDGMAVVKSSWFLQSPICSVHGTRAREETFGLQNHIITLYCITPTFTHFSLWFRSSSLGIIQFNPKHALLIAHARFCRDWKWGKCPSVAHRVNIETIRPVSAKVKATVRRADLNPGDLKYILLQGRCNREKPACKYFHPPQHLKVKQQSAFVLKS